MSSFTFARELARSGRGTSATPRPEIVRSSWPDVEDDRDGPVVHELELHPGTEDTCCDRRPERAQRRAEAVVERLGLLRPRRLGEARPVAPGRVRDEREVRDD